MLESTILGSTGRSVSRLGFGGAPAGLTDYLGKYSPEQDEQREQVIAAIQRAVELGVTYFDTAAAYGRGESERIFGEALEGAVTRPSDVLLADGAPEMSALRPTHPLSSSPPSRRRGQDSPPSSSLPRREGGQDGPPSGSLPRREGEQDFPSPLEGEGRGEGLSGWTADAVQPDRAQQAAPLREEGRGDQPQAGRSVFLATKVSHSEADVRGSVERSLRNLRVDRIDLVQVHGGSYSDAHEDAVMRTGGVLETLEKARDEGLIRHIGFTTEDQSAPVYRFIRSGSFDVMQIQYNLLFQHPYSPDRPFGAMVEAEAAKMGIVTMRTLTSGVFQKWMRAVRTGDSFDYSPALLQFVLSNPLVDVALVGMRTPEEVEHNIAVLNYTAGRVDISELHSKYV